VGSGATEAATIRLDFDGTVSKLDDPDGILSSLLPSLSFSVGDAVRGFYEVDDAAVPSASGSVPEGGTYYHLDLIGNIEAIVADNPALVGLETVATVQIANSVLFPSVPDPFDYWQYRQNLVDPQGGSDFLVLTYTLLDFTDARLSDDGFFLNDSLAGWQTVQMDISHISGTGVFVRTLLTADMVISKPQLPTLSPWSQLALVASLLGAGLGVWRSRGTSSGRA